MENDVIIKVENLSKKFALSLKRSLLYGTADVVKSMLGLKVDSARLRKGEFWSLKDINFELRKGETLGVIGVNGSGKSTLLRILTGIFPPDKGKVMVKGKLGSLIAVGAGFHPHMTGRENIYLNGIILGMSREEIDKKFNEIVEFADIGEFLDAPVSTYSSGMRVRLGFSIAVQSEPDILLVDEVLSVGDLSFRNKSLRKMNELREKAGGLIFVSHSLEQIKVLCTRVIVLDKGDLVFDGDVQEGCVVYEELTRNVRQHNLKQELTSQAKIIRNENSIISSLDGNENVEILDIGILEGDKEVESIGMEDALNLFCDFKVEKESAGLYFSFAIIDEQRTKNVIRVVSHDSGKNQFSNIQAGSYRIMTKIDKHHLEPGVYIPQVAVRNEVTGETYERSFKQTPFKVTSDGKTMERGLIHVKEKWELIKL